MLRDARTIAIPLTIRRFSSLPEDLDDGGCLTCGGSLDLHQPDAGSPDRIVGVCPKCESLYLLDTIPGTNEAVMVRLPDGETLRKALIG
jgi:hypothetical protein